MQFLTVKATSERVPREGGGWIEPGESARVQESYYYRQRLADGSLARIFDSEAAQAECAVPVDVSGPPPFFGTPHPGNAPAIIAAPELERPSRTPKSSTTSSSSAESTR